VPDLYFKLRGRLFKLKELRGQQDLI